MSTLPSTIIAAPTFTVTEKNHYGVVISVKKLEGMVDKGGNVTIQTDVLFTSGFN